MDQQGQQANQQPAAGGTTPPAPDAAAPAGVTPPAEASPAAAPMPEGAPAGAPVPGSTPPTGAVPPADPAPKKSFAKVLVIVLVFLIFGLGGFIAWQTFSSSSTSEAEKKVVVEPTVVPTATIAVSPTGTPVASGEADLMTEDATPAAMGR